MLVALAILLIAAHGMGSLFARLGQPPVRTVGLIAGFGMILPFAAGLGLVEAMGAREFIGPARNHAALVLVFGLAVAVTSIPVISRIIHDLDLLSTRFARIVLSVAVTEDIVLYVVLAVAVGLVQTTSNTAFGIPAAWNLHTIPRNGAYHTVALRPCLLRAHRPPARPAPPLQSAVLPGIPVLRLRNQSCQRLPRSTARHQNQAAEQLPGHLDTT